VLAVDFFIANRRFKTGSDLIEIIGFKFFSNSIGYPPLRCDQSLWLDVAEFMPRKKEPVSSCF